MKSPRLPINLSTTGAATMALLGVFAIGCGDNPQYVQGPAVLEANSPGGSADRVTGTVDLPIRVETEEQLAEREALATELGLGLDEVPFVKMGDLSISVEWTIKNLSDSDGVARVQLNAGNDTWFYMPSNFQIGEEDEEEPPPLIGDIPYQIPAGGQLSGVFREDELREGAIDLELITRQDYNPIAAVLENNEDVSEVTDQASGNVIPIRVFRSIIRFNIDFIANQHMVLEYTVRVREHEDRLHPELLDAPPEEIIVFNPAEYVPSSLTGTTGQ